MSEQLYQLGVDQFKQKNYEEAIKYFSQSYINGKDDFNILRALGITYFHLKKYKISMEFLSKAYFIDSGDEHLKEYINNCSDELKYIRKIDLNSFLLSICPFISIPIIFYNQLLGLLFVPLCVCLDSYINKSKYCLYSDTMFTHRKFSFGSFRWFVHIALLQIVYYPIYLYRRKFTTNTDAFMTGICLYVIYLLLILLPVVFLASSEYSELENKQKYSQGVNAIHQVQKQVSLPSEQKQLPSEPNPIQEKPEEEPNIQESYISYNEFCNLFGTDSKLTDVQKALLFKNEYKGKYISWIGMVENISENFSVLVKNNANTFTFDINISFSNQEERNKLLEINIGDFIQYSGLLENYGGVFLPTYVSGISITKLN